GDWSRTGRFRSLLTGKETEVTVRAKTVDGTYFNTTVPSTHTPNFEIEAGATLRPLNDLPKLTERPDGFTVVGGGKTAIDAVLWLLERVDPEMIRWIKPRDGWLINRANTQPTEEFFANTIGAQAAQMEAAAAATDVDDLFRRLEEAKVLLRIYPDVKPSMYHGATISEAEVEALRAVTNVVRLGRVTRLGLHEIELERGSIPTTPGTFHVDCSARAVPGAEIVPVFTEDRITVQTVRTIQPVFSAAFIAHVEVAYETVKEKNRLCQVVLIPNHDTDWMRVTAALMMNQMAWSKDDGLRAWLEANRLDGFTAMVRAVDEWDEEKMAILGRLRAAGRPAMANLMRMIGELNAAA
ncbi:MAG: NAD(P)/FAD-dependent oxidoreductase, partial [Pseudomonadota bacterium]